MTRYIKNTEKAIQRLIRYLEGKGYQVKLNGNDRPYSECDPQTRIITINEDPGLHQLYILLHEAGHALIFGLDDYNEAFCEIKNQDWKLPEDKDNLYHYQVLKEEMLAWETGLNIASKLKIYVDANEYDKLASNCYMSYCYRASQNHYQDAVKDILEQSGVTIKFNNCA